MPERFNVIIWFDGFWEYFLRDVDAKSAVQAAKRCVFNLGERNLADKVMITDEDDNTNFLWERGKGIVYPPREEEP